MNNIDLIENIIRDWAQSHTKDYTIDQGDLSEVENNFLWILQNKKSDINLKLLIN